MSRKYKTYEGGLFFVTLTVINWIDVFTRNVYCDEIIKNLNYCIENKGLRVYSYVIMSNHIHLICSVDKGLLSNLLRDFKGFTSKKLIKMIKENPKESRKKWMLYMFEYYGTKNCRNEKYQFWQQHNHPIDLKSDFLIQQKHNYILNNPVKAGIVDNPENYAYCSANPYSKLKLADF